MACRSAREAWESPASGSPAQAGKKAGFNRLAMCSNVDAISRPGGGAGGLRCCWKKLKADGCWDPRPCRPQGSPVPGSIQHRAPLGEMFWDPEAKKLVSPVESSSQNPAAVTGSTRSAPAAPRGALPSREMPHPFFSPAPHQPSHALGVPTGASLPNSSVGLGAGGGDLGARIDRRGRQQQRRAAVPCRGPVAGCEHAAGPSARRGCGERLGWETAPCQKHFHRDLSPPTNVFSPPLSP